MKLTGMLRLSIFEPLDVVKHVSLVKRRLQRGDPIIRALLPAGLFDDRYQFDFSQ